MPTMTRTRVHAHAGSTAGTARKVGDEGPLGCHSEPLQDPPSWPPLLLGLGSSWSSLCFPQKRPYFLPSTFPNGF